MSNEDLREEIDRLVAKLETIKGELDVVGSTITSLLGADVPNLWSREMSQAEEHIRRAILSVDWARIRADRVLGVARWISSLRGETVDELQSPGEAVNDGRGGSSSCYRKKLS